MAQQYPISLLNVNYYLTSFGQLGLPGGVRQVFSDFDLLYTGFSISISLKTQGLSFFSFSTDFRILSLLEMFSKDINVNGSALSLFS